MQDSHIIYQAPAAKKILSYEEIIKRRVQRRRRVSKRMIKRFPLFAAEFMRDEFPDIDNETIIEDVTRKTRKSKSKRKIKSPLKRQGRYCLYEKALNQYLTTGEQKHLQEAQHWRNRLYLPYELVYIVEGKKEYVMLNSDVPINKVKELSKITYSNRAEFCAKFNKIIEWCRQIPWKME